MPKIIPISDLKNTAAISAKCRRTDAPIFITKNGYGDMVIMSMKHYEERLARLDLYTKLEEAENDILADRVAPAQDALKHLRTKYDV